LQSRLRPGDRWRCEQAPDEGWIRFGEDQALVEGARIRFERPADYVRSLRPFGLVVDNRRIPLPYSTLPDGEPQERFGMAVRALDDLWFLTPEHLFRGDGMVWSEVQTNLAALRVVWLGEAGVVWVLGAAEKDADNSAQALRWEVAHDTFARFATPGAIQVRRAGVVGGWGLETPDRERSPFWLLGKRAVYWWNGRSFGAMDTPVEIRDGARQAWVSAQGALWVVGANRGLDGSAADGDGLGGAVFRLAPFEGSSQ
jgi:hypothetical protein